MVCSSVKYETVMYTPLNVLSVIGGMHASVSPSYRAPPPLHSYLRVASFPFPIVYLFLEVQS